jgi:hypothetical protein
MMCFPAQRERVWALAAIFSPSDTIGWIGIPLAAQIPQLILNRKRIAGDEILLPPFPC